jgi:ribosome maturation factor RimP
VSSQQPSQQHSGAGAGAREDIMGRLEPVVAEAVGTLGFDLEALDVTVAGRRRLVKVVVDADDGVELDLLSEVSRVVSAALDANDDILASAYTLEVTSPGVDRPLTKPRHWRRAKLRLVKIRKHDGIEFTGRVGAADDGGVDVLVDGTLRRVDYAGVARAAVEIEFRQPPSAELLLLERGTTPEVGGPEVDGPEADAAGTNSATMPETTSAPDGTDAKATKEESR